MRVYWPFNNNSNRGGTDITRPSTREKSMNILFLSILCFASAASGQPEKTKTGLVNTETIEYPAVVFAYADQELVEPFSWEGIGTEKLYIVDGNGTRVLFHPLPTHPDFLPPPRPAYSEAQLDSMRDLSSAKYALGERAKRALDTNGEEAMIEVYESDPLVDHVEKLAYREYKVVFKDGDPEYLMYACSHRYVPKSRAEVHQEMIDKFLAAHERGSTIWFGTSHRNTWRADFEQVETYREAIRRLKRGEELTPEQMNTPAGYDHGIQYDATH